MQDTTIPTFLAGLAFAAVSLVSIGPNNILLLREGLGRGRPALVAAVMWLSYFVLLSLAVFGGNLLGPMMPGASPMLMFVLRGAGAFVLAVMGIAALRATVRFAPDFAAPESTVETGASAAARVLRVVWLNPLTYLELLVIPASLALPLAGFDQRCALFAGMLLIFAVNCFGFSLGASLLSPLFGQPSRLRLFDGLSGAVMIVLAVLIAAQIARPLVQAGKSGLTFVSGAEAAQAESTSVFR